MADATEVWKPYCSGTCELLELSMGFQLDGGRLQLPDSRFEIRWGNLIGGPQPPSGMIQIDSATSEINIVRRDGPTDPNKPWLRPGQYEQPAPWDPTPLLTTPPAPSANSNMPPGWRQQFAQDGRPFFVTPNGQTQWEPPVEVPASLSTVLPGGDSHTESMASADTVSAQTPPPPLQRYRVTVPQLVGADHRLVNLESMTTASGVVRAEVLLRVPVGLGPGQEFELDFESTL